MRTTGIKQRPEGHPISLEKAKALVNGSLGQVYKDIAFSCSAPLLWFRQRDNSGRILHNGTTTLTRTSKKLFGITAAHVVDQYNNDLLEGEVTLQLKNELIGTLRIIDYSSKRDLATIDFDEQFIEHVGLEPLMWPPHPPSEGKGLLLAGYPGNNKIYAGSMTIDWSPFFAITTARTVTSDQISVLIPREDRVKNSLPLNHNLGGISGGPIIGIFETENHLAFHRLSGVITEHPSYDENDFSIERILGSTVDAITELGNIR